MTLHRTTNHRDKIKAYYRARFTPAELRRQKNHLEGYARRLRHQITMAPLDPEVWDGEFAAEELPYVQAEIALIEEVEREAQQANPA